MNPQMNIELSFCIPTYNRAESALDLVTTILSCSDPEIEVVVLDNGSTDDTLARLGGIQDERLVVYSNGENKGGLYNVVNVIDKARGRFLVFSTDKDHVNPDKIIGFKSFLLQHPDLASGYCLFNSQTGVEYESFRQGYQAVSKIAYKGRHPTGYFFNNVLLKSIRHVERFSDFKFVDMFPFEFIHAELCMLGSGAIYCEPMFTLETGTMAAKHKSYNASGKTKEAFFSPEARLKMAINYTAHINTLQLGRRDRKKLMVAVFLQQLAAATIGYRSILGNKNLCAHYHMECKYLDAREQIRIGWNFFRQYRTETSVFWGRNPLSQLTFEIHVVSEVIMKIARRAVNYIKHNLSGRKAPA